MSQNRLVTLVNTELKRRYGRNTDKNVAEAMKSVDRAYFLDGSILLWTTGPEALDHLYTVKQGLSEPAEDLSTLRQSIDNVLDTVVAYMVRTSDLAYNNLPLPIGKGSWQVTSDPTSFAYMAGIMKLERGMRVLEIGTGLGYDAALVCHLIGNEGCLITMEISPENAAKSVVNLRRHFGRVELAKERFKVLWGDGSVGVPEEGPFNRIYLTGSVDSSFDPLVLAKQLSENGKLIYPLKDGVLVERTYAHGGFREQKYLKVHFPPLRGINS